MPPGMNCRRCQMDNQAATGTSTFPVDEADELGIVFRCADYLFRLPKNKSLGAQDDGIFSPENRCRAGFGFAGGRHQVFSRDHAPRHPGTIQFPWGQPMMPILLFKFLEVPNLRFLNRPKMQVY